MPVAQRELRLARWRAARGERGAATRRVVVEVERGRTGRGARSGRSGPGPRRRRAARSVTSSPSSAATAPRVTTTSRSAVRSAGRPSQRLHERRGRRRRRASAGRSSPAGGQGDGRTTAGAGVLGRAPRRRRQAADSEARAGSVAGQAPAVGARRAPASSSGGPVAARTGRRRAAACRRVGGRALGGHGPQHERVDGGDGAPVASARCSATASRPRAGCRRTRRPVAPAACRRDAAARRTAADGARFAGVVATVGEPTACRAASSSAGCRPKRGGVAALVLGRGRPRRTGSSPRRQAARRPWKTGP